MGVEKIILWPLCIVSTLYIGVLLFKKVRSIYKAIHQTPEEGCEDTTKCSDCSEKDNCPLKQEK